MAEEGKKEKSNRLTWKDFLPIILAFPMAILVKIFIFTTYHVPTASMVPTIIPGDHILVEKWVFGPRMYINGKVYRLPGWRSISRGDILVFNVPKEDSIFQHHRDVNYYNWKQSQASSPSPEVKKDSFQFMPIPGRTPFVKRVIGLPGDTLEFASNAIYINQEPLQYLFNSYQHYEIVFKNNKGYDRYKDHLYQIGEHIQMNRADHLLTGIFKASDLNFLKKVPIKITPLFYFPDPADIPGDFTWVRSLAQSHHAMRIPQEGWTATVDSLFLQEYGQILRRFEGFRGKISKNQLLDMKGNVLDQYTFKQNYYWAMGDNRPYSVDSRAWGIIPEDHIIGITRRTFWSKEPELGFKAGFRWERFWERL